VKIESKGDLYSATPLWTNAAFGARFTTPILKDGMVYGFSGHLFCVNAQSGATVWDEAVSLGRSASLVDAGSVLFAGGNRGELLAFKPGSPYTQFALFKLVDTETWAHPIVSGNRIFVKDNETVGLWTIE
jgi:outer membrane protein assembly factor BamB